MQNTTNRKGFTLIELLIVVVIIGILAAVAIPKFANTKEKAYVASMKADLKNLVGVQEAFYADSAKYGDKDALNGKYSSSQGNTMDEIAGDATGWSAKVTNASVSDETQKSCYIFGGSGDQADANKGGAEAEGVPTCKAGA